MSDLPCIHIRNCDDPKRGRPAPPVKVGISSMPHAVCVKCKQVARLPLFSWHAHGSIP